MSRILDAEENGFMATRPRGERFFFAKGYFKSTRLTEYINRRYADAFNDSPIQGSEHPDFASEIDEWVADINLFHVFLSEGNPLVIDRIENYSVDEYHSYLVANKKRNAEIKKQMEAARNKHSVSSGHSD